MVIRSIIPKDSKKHKTFGVDIDGVLPITSAKPIIKIPYIMDDIRTSILPRKPVSTLEKSVIVVEIR